MLFWPSISWMPITILKSHSLPNLPHQIKKIQWMRRSSGPYHGNTQQNNQKSPTTKFISQNEIQSTRRELLPPSQEYTKQFSKVTHYQIYHTKWNPVDATLFSASITGLLEMPQSVAVALAKVFFRNKKCVVAMGHVTYMNGACDT